MGHRGGDHRAALQNWRRVVPDSEIVLFGACEGAEPVCEALPCKWHRDVESSETGAPRFNAIAEWARAHAQFDVQVYLNADILLPPDFCTYMMRLPSVPFLMVGQRVDLFRNAAFDAEAFYAQLKQALASRQAEIHRPTGMDFFVFRRGLWSDLSPLTVGRGAYDSALLTYCLRKRIPVIDASFAFPVVHQKHGYEHVDGGKDWAHYGPEARFNVETHGLRRFAPNCIDADLSMLRSGTLAKNVRWSLLRRLEVEFYYRRGWAWTPHFCQAWHFLTRGGRKVANPDWCH